MDEAFRGVAESLKDIADPRVRAFAGEIQKSRLFVGARPSPMPVVKAQAEEMATLPIRTADIPRACVLARRRQDFLTASVIFSIIPELDAEARERERAEEMKRRAALAAAPVPEVPPEVLAEFSRKVKELIDVSRETKK